jgi:hypothetical protein
MRDMKPDSEMNLTWKRLVAFNVVAIGLYLILDTAAIIPASLVPAVKMYLSPLLLLMGIGFALEMVVLSLRSASGVCRQMIALKDEWLIYGFIAMLGVASYWATKSGLSDLLIGNGPIPALIAPGRYGESLISFAATRGIAFLISAPTCIYLLHTARGIRRTRSTSCPNCGHPRGPDALNMCPECGFGQTPPG